MHNIKCACVFLPNWKEMLTRSPLYVENTRLKIFLPFTAFNLVCANVLVEIYPQSCTFNYNEDLNMCNARYFTVRWQCICRCFYKLYLIPEKVTGNVWKQHLRWCRFNQAFLTIVIGCVLAGQPVTTYYFYQFSPKNAVFRNMRTWTLNVYDFKNN